MFHLTEFTISSSMSVENLVFLLLATQIRSQRATDSDLSSRVPHNALELKLLSADALS